MVNCWQETVICSTPYQSEVYYLAVDTAYSKLHQHFKHDGAGQIVPLPGAVLVSASNPNARQNPRLPSGAPGPSPLSCGPNHSSSLLAHRVRRTYLLFLRSNLPFARAAAREPL